MALTKDQSLADLTGLFGMLSDKTRLHMLFLLAKEDQNVTSLCEALKVRQPTASHHLGLLRMSGMVTTKRMGKQIVYSLAEAFTSAGGKLRISLPSCRVTIEES